ncbi:MAG: glycosyltransferase family 2 protein [Pseudomonadota bacterium]
MRDGPTLSACLVVKNEELFLDTCLASLRNVVDELIVVDTGSVDRTIKIAERWADIVTREPWPGDLGQAHDLPIAHASGDWILTLDGDERLDPSGAAVVAALLRDTAHDGFILPVRNYLFHPGPGFRPADPFDPLTHGARCWQPSQNVRLFRNDPRFRHRGHLHQSPVTSIDQAGGTIGRCECVIHHYGWLRTDRDKGAFYGALLERDAAASPHDPQVHLELAFARRVEGDDAGATRACLRAIELGETSRGWAEL